MATEVPMPKLGLTMEEGTIIEWLVADGDQVAPEQPIMLIETDKTETEVGAPSAGRLQLVGAPGQTYPCGALVAWLLAEGEAPPSGSPSAAAVTAGLGPATDRIAQTGGVPGSLVSHDPPVEAPGGRLIASPNARRVAADRGVALGSVRGTGPGGRIVSEDVEATAALTPATSIAPSTAPAVAADSYPVIATAAARQLADLLGVDLASVVPDPIEARITRDGVAIHVRRLLAAKVEQPAAAPATGTWPLLQEPVETIRLSGMRGTIAKRMTASLREMAQLTLTIDADMAAVLADRARRKAVQPGASVPSITDYVLAAAARALLRHPSMNAQVTEAGIAVLREVHVGLAVAVPDGLFVPVIRDTAQRDLVDLAAETARLAAAARAGTLTPADLEGGTFSVSTLGMFGVDAFTPVINPPNAGILGVGRIRDELVLVDGAVAAVPRATLSLTWDHRVLDGAPAAEFGRTVVELLADPDRLS